MIDPSTGWIEIRIVLSARADFIANQVKLSGLTRYPLLNKIKVDTVNKFLNKFREMITKDYCMMVKSITSRNPQANTILERVH